MEDNSKYPWTKSIFGKKKKQFECVYAGPGMMPADKEGPPINKPVYAAPSINEKKPAPMEGVYAGPRNDFNEVYAGPEYFGIAVPKDDEEPEELPEPEPEEKPEFIPPSQFMAVYAGPEYFNGGSGRPAGVKLDVSFCEKCGALLKPEYKFCTECGEPVVKKV